MKAKWIWILIIISWSSISTARPMTYYYYLTGYERTRFNEIIWFYGPAGQFGEGDTIEGPWRTNDFWPFNHHYQNRAIFKDRFITTQENPGYDTSRVVFMVPPAFREVPFQFPDNLSELRDAADFRISREGGFWQRGAEWMTWIKGRNNRGLDIYRYQLGLAPAESLVAFFPIDDERRIIFVDGKVEVEGIFAGQLSIASSDDIYLIDDVLYPEADPHTGEFDEEETESMLAIASEKNIIIKDNIRNGKGWGINVDPNNWNRHSIVLNGSYIALGSSFTFEHQNDDWEAYQGPEPDERGTVYMQGGIIQQRRGYLHRSNHTGTGYTRHFRYDSRLKTHGPPGFDTDDVPDIINLDGEYERLTLPPQRYTLTNLVVGTLAVQAGTILQLVGPNALTVHDTLSIAGRAGLPVRILPVGGSGGISVTDGNLVDISNVQFFENVTVSFSADTMIIDFSAFNCPVALNGVCSIDNTSFDDPHDSRWTGEITINKSFFLGRGVGVTGEASRLNLMNCTLVGGNGYGVDLRDGANGEIVNSIVAFQRYGIYRDNRSSLSIRFSDIYGNTIEDFLNCEPGEGALIDDPLFVDIRAGDYHLRESSPCIDAGDPDTPRDPDGTRADIGAFYFDHELKTGDSDFPLCSQGWNTRGGGLSASPNPFNSATVIRFQSARSAVHLSIYDLAGRTVAEIASPAVFARNEETKQSQGGLAKTSSVTWDASAFPAGIYIVRYANGREVQTMKLLKVN